ncbi:MAG: DUF4956 domain-containing protein [Spartobacteria bacterium]|nr:DUF4956 domain-containing protein [Spartobacteria bacterium]
MSNLLQQLAGGSSLSLGLGAFIICLLASVVSSFIVEVMYSVFYENRATGSQIHRSFILLGPAITFLFISVQLSLPLSLGLLGALSIVRFRTPIKEPEEIGFLMLLIAGSIGIATFNFSFVCLLYVITFLVLCLRRWTPFRRRLAVRREGMLLINLADDVYEEHGQALGEQLSGHFRRLQIESISSVEGTTNLEYVFSGVAKTPWVAFQKELHSHVPYNKLNIFFTRPGPMD